MPRLSRGTGWWMAASATLHCLTGCAIGEVLGLVIGTALALSNAVTIGLAIVLAFIFGYSLTMVGALRGGLPVRSAARLALAADTVSITVMELVDNAVVLVVPGAMTAGLVSGLFWGSLALGLAAAFVVALPVNRVMIGLGRGHVVAHGGHSGSGTPHAPHVDHGPNSGHAPHNHHGPHNRTGPHSHAEPSTPATHDPGA